MISLKNTSCRFAWDPNITVPGGHGVEAGDARGRGFGYLSCGLHHIEGQQNLPEADFLLYTLILGASLGHGCCGRSPAA
jgi:hypothetical protein